MGRRLMGAMAPIYSTVEQRSARRPHKPQVVGSTPTCATSFRLLCNSSLEAYSIPHIPFLSLFSIFSPGGKKFPPTCLSSSTVEHRPSKPGTRVRHSLEAPESGELSSWFLSFFCLRGRQQATAALFVKKGNKKQRRQYEARSPESQDRKRRHTLSFMQLKAWRDILRWSCNGRRTMVQRLPQTGACRSA